MWPRVGRDETMKQTVGFAVCGSHCNFSAVRKAMEALAKDFDLLPILSNRAAGTDTRFTTAAEFRKEVERITGKSPICTVEGAEPIGPQKLLDLLLICPCTGNTVAKLALGITDTPVTMAFKAHMRNNRPVLLSIATNDGLGANAQNIGRLLNTRNVFFVPFGQDDPVGKIYSLNADLRLLNEACVCALKGKQLQPVLRSF